MRISTRGSFHAAPTGSERNLRLKLLLIVHRKLIADEGIGLGWRRIAAVSYRAEYVRAFQFGHKSDDRLDRVRRYLHFKEKPTLRVDGGADGENAHVRRTDCPQVGKDLRPADGL